MPHEPFPPVAPYSVDSWANYAVPGLERILAEDLNAGFDRALAWGRVGSLISAAMEALKVARENLADAWTAESSSAALRFVEEVDNLRGQMQQISDAAWSNKPILVRALESFEGSRSEIIKLANEWRFNATQERGSVTGDSVIANTSAQAWRQSLNDRAHQYLQASDEAAFEESQALRVPADFRAGSLDAFSTGKSGNSVDLGNGPLGDGVIDTSSQIASSGPGSPPVAGQGSASSRDPWVAPVFDGVIAGDGFVSGVGAVGGAVSGRGPGQHYTTGPDRADEPSLRSLPLDSPDRVRAANPDDNYPLGAMPMVGGIGAAASGRTRARRRGSSQPERWQTLSGVPGVLLPANVETVHDPGPGVLGIDR